jgi:hypothetical protein
MITEDYVSFEIAKLLKEKGFDGECQGYYEVPTKISLQKDVRKQLNVLPKNWNEYNKECVVCEYISIPTHQMVLKWLREVHNIHCTIDIGYGSKAMYFSNVYSTKKSGALHNETGYYNSYEEAVEAALLYVLKNLI